MKTKMQDREIEVSASPDNENPPDIGGSSAGSGPYPPGERGEEILPKRVLCPSAPAQMNSILLGVVQIDGSVAFVKDRLQVTREFLDIAAKDGAPETRFRFSSPCIGSACKQWANGGCSVPGRLVEILPRAASTNPPLPNCSIRDQCRWFDQEGAAACRICPVVITRSH